MDTVIKRDGATVPFDKQKIFNVIGKANNVVKDKESMSFTDILYVTNKVVAEIEKRGVSHVEEIQDVVIDMLIKYEYPETSKEYIIYRSEHNKIRNSEIDLMDIYNKLTFVDSKDIDIKRENANIDGNTAMGTMLKYGSEGSKYFVDNYVLPKDISLAHASGEIHIHDKDFYMLTETCCQIDLLKLFKNGFSTGHGYLREPNSIESYSALACIAIQANQNEMHGGQSVPNFDYAMAPGIVKTYKSEFKRAFATYLQVEAVSRELPTDEPFNADDITDILETFMFLDKFNAAQTIAEVDALMTDLIALIESDTTGKLISWMYKSSDLHEKYPNLTDDDLKITMAGFIDILKKAIPFSKQEALARTDRRCYQAMEALVHNLNTMSSRAGAQVPFSSLNYGTDISPEGRMVIKNILLSTESGLGNGETSIFPVQIFKLKEGVNYNTEDPNYDLFKLSMRVSAKRLFPKQYWGLQIAI